MRLVVVVTSDLVTQIQTAYQISINIVDANSNICIRLELIRNLRFWVERVGVAGQQLGLARQNIIRFGVGIVGYIWNINWILNKSVKGDSI